LKKEQKKNSQRTRIKIEEPEGEAIGKNKLKIPWAGKKNKGEKGGKRDGRRPAHVVMCWYLGKIERVGG